MKENITRRMIKIIVKAIASILLVAIVFTVYCIMRMSSKCSREEEKEERHYIDKQ